MDESTFVEELERKGLTRRDFIRKTAAVGAGVTALGMLEIEPALGAGQLDKVKWISPRGSLDVMDDYNLWVPTKMGYFRKLGISVTLNAGDASGNLPSVASRQVDMGYASPGVMTAAIDAGIPVVSIWEMFPGQVFDFVVSADSKITSPKQLKGKTISVYNIGWKNIVNPMLAEVGVDPKTVKYREFGPQWNQAVALKLVDAGLSWEGLRAQLQGTAGFFGSGNAGLKFLIGSKWGSKLPSNSYQVRRSDLDDPKKRDIYTRLLAGVVMGFEFCRANPRAAAQITYEQLPALQSQIPAQLALESMMQLATIYHVSRRQAPHLYGYHYPAAWQKYLNFIFKFGQTKKHLTLEGVLTNDLVKPANAKADKARAARDAKAFKLNAAFRKTKVPNYPL